MVESSNIAEVHNVVAFILKTYVLNTVFIVLTDKTELYLD